MTIYIIMKSYSYGGITTLSKKDRGLLADESGLHHVTVSLALKRLVVHGYLKKLSHKEYQILGLPEPNPPHELIEV